MKNIQLLIEAMDYIEANLNESINTEEIANHLYCSKSTIEKLFKYVNNISIRDYIIRRRMSKAAKEMVRCPSKSLLEIGIEYGYGSNEAFSRAFYGVWQVSPSEFRKNPSEYELFPGFKIDRELMEEKNMEQKKKVDISELYDCIKARKNCYVIVCDIKRLTPINAISTKAGDLVIITAMQRMQDAAGDEDVVFRIGGDEFAILTDSTEEEYAKSISTKIISQNNDCIVWEGREIPVSMYAKPVLLDVNGTLRYSELFVKLQNELSDESKRLMELEEQKI